MKYLIFLNIKRWLLEYGIDLFDFMLKPDNTMTNDTTKRYNDFLHRFNRHFSSGVYYKSNFSSHLPLLTLQVHDLGYSTPCHREYMLDFKYHFTTISADTYTDYENTPEFLYETEDFVDKFLTNMMSSSVFRNGLLIHRTIFKDLFTLPNFDKTIENVSSIEEYPMEFLAVKEEVNSLVKQFKVTIGECH